MKPILRIFCACFAMCAFTFSLHAQQALTSNDLFVQVPGITDGRGFPEIRDALASIDGITVQGFCDNIDVIIIHIDRVKQPDDLAVRDKMNRLGFEYYFKEGSLQEVMNACSEHYFPATKNADH